MTLNLNIYAKDENGVEFVEKQYTAESYDLMLGTVDDLMQIMDADKMTDKKEIIRMVAREYNKLKPFIKEIFPGVTDAELRNVKVKELIPIFIDVFRTVVEDIEILKTGN